MDVNNKVRAWKEIEAYLSMITDPLLQNSLRREYALKAKKEWGFCPADMKAYKEDEIVPDMDEEEKALYERIQTYIEYGVDVMSDEEKQRLDARTMNNMIDFVDKGGTYWEIPKEIRCDSLKAMYDKACDIVFDVEKFTKNA